MLGGKTLFYLPQTPQPGPSGKGEKQEGLILQESYSKCDKLTQAKLQKEKKINNHLFDTAVFNTYST